MAATASACRLSTASSSSFTLTANTERPINSLTPFNSCILFPALKTIPTISLSLSLTRSKVLHSKPVPSKHVYKVLAISGSANGDSETHPESKTFDSKEDATIDIKLPRRSLLVLFTCDSCGERTKRLVNRLAYERGLVFVQDYCLRKRWLCQGCPLEMELVCAGCLQHHKLVDNLGLVVEYDLREEINAESNKDEV